MIYKIIFTLESRSELKEITKYIAQDNEDIALAFSSKMTRDIQDKLSFMPSMYRVYKGNMRIFPYGNYIIFYEIKTDIQQVEILHIIH